MCLFFQNYPMTNNSFGNICQKTIRENIMILKLLAHVEAWKASKDGATAIEYGLIAAGIAVAISAVVFTFGEELSAMFSDMSTKISGAGAA